MEFSNHDDFFFMNYAIRLALRHVGLTGENPSVGCVLVSDRRIISYGITGIGGSPHAEFEALSKLKKIPKDTKIPLFPKIKETSHTLILKPIIENMFPK